jgi:hypothetical protein
MINITKDSIPIVEEFYDLTDRKREIIIIVVHIINDKGIRPVQVPYNTPAIFCARCSFVCASRTELYWYTELLNNTNYSYNYTTS